MRLRQVDNPHMAEAEGDCLGFPYNTVLVSINGVSIHFWVGDAVDMNLLKLALAKAVRARDIVSCTWSHGEPDGYWAHQDIT